jgi:hypothetical protein
MHDVNRKKLCLKLSNIFIRLRYKINFSLLNKTSHLLATDLLRPNVKRKLFNIVLKNVEFFFLDLIKMSSDNDNKSFLKMDHSIFLNLIKCSSEEFLINYYGSHISLSSILIKDSLYTKYLLEETKIILLTPFEILYNCESSIFLSIFSPITGQVSDNIIEALLDNLLVEITNAITFFIINEFSLIYNMRRSLYRSIFLSVRNVERFRNNLSWQLNIRRFVKKPSNLYNSEQGIWLIKTTGICYRIIYANHSNELLVLDKYAMFTLFFIEIKDFLFSRIDEIVYFFGNTIKYQVSSTLGQVIAVIWRNIIEGLKK